MTPDAPSDPPRRIAWTAQGPFAFTEEGTGPTLVLLHGLPGSSRDFRWLCASFAGRVRAIRLEQPGFGLTPRSTGTGTSHGDRVRFVLDAADSLGLSRFFVLGHSIGGPLAMGVAARAPARVQGLALLASVGLHVHRAARRVGRTPDWDWALALGPVAALVLPSMRASFQRVGFPASTPDGELVESARVFSRLRFADVREAALAVRAPTLLAWADDDPAVEPAIGLSLGSALPPGERIRFDTGGHNIQKTRAVELAAALASWMIQARVRRLEPPLEQRGCSASLGIGGELLGREAR